MTVLTLDPTEGAPPEPDWRSEFPGRAQSVLADRVEASRLWGVAVRELRGTDKLAAANAHAVKRLVLAWIAYDRAAREVARKGAVVKAPKTGTPMHSPWWSTMIQAGKMAAQLEAELTISPRSRDDGGTIPRPPRPTTGADRFLTRRDRP